jgi:hypothetical protein
MRNFKRRAYNADGNATRLVRAEGNDGAYSGKRALVSAVIGEWYKIIGI